MPLINVSETLKEYDRMKNSVAVFRFFNQKIKVKIEEENNQVYFVIPKSQKRRTKLNKEQKRGLANIILPWFNLDSDENIFSFIDNIDENLNIIDGKKQRLNDLKAAQKRSQDGRVEITTLDFIDLINKKPPTELDAITLLAKLLRDYERTSNPAALNSSINVSQLQNQARDVQQDTGSIASMLEVTKSNKNITKNLQEAYEKLNEAFQIQMLGANLDDEDQNSSNALWLPVLKELINCTIALGAFGEAIHDVRKSHNLVHNYNYWLEHELVNLYLLETELAKLKSTQKMIEFKILREGSNKQNKSITDLKKWESNLFKEQDLYKIAELSVDEYRKKLRPAFQKYFLKEQELDQDQALLLLTMLEIKHTERLIETKQQGIFSRNNVVAHHINCNNKLSSDEKLAKRNEIKKMIDKYTNRNSESLILDGEKFYDQLCHPLLDSQWRLTYSALAAFGKVNNDIMSQLRVEHQKNTRKLKARGAILAGSVLAVTALVLTATLGFGTPVILLTVGLLLLTIAAISLGEYWLKDSFKEVKNCVSSIFSKYQASEKLAANKEYAENSASTSNDETDRSVRMDKGRSLLLDQT